MKPLPSKATASFVNVQSSRPSSPCSRFRLTTSRTGSDVSCHSSRRSHGGPVQAPRQQAPRSRQVAVGSSRSASVPELRRKCRPVPGRSTAYHNRSFNGVSHAPRVVGTRASAAASTPSPTRGSSHSVAWMPALLRIAWASLSGDSAAMAHADAQTHSTQQIGSLMMIRFISAPFLNAVIRHLEGTTCPAYECRPHHEMPAGTTSPPSVGLGTSAPQYKSTGYRNP